VKEKMDDKEFEPIGRKIGLAGTPYSIQIGTINGKLAIRLLKGKEPIKDYIFKDEEIKEGYPHPNAIFGWAFGTVSFPDMNPYGVKKTISAILEELSNFKNQNYDES
jgi:hypothetical protein